jgi:hypothetical protein
VHQSTDITNAEAENSQVRHKPVYMFVCTHIYNTYMHIYIYRLEQTCIHVLQKNCEFIVHQSTDITNAVASNAQGRHKPLLQLLMKVCMYVCVCIYMPVYMRIVCMCECVYIHHMSMYMFMYCIVHTYVHVYVLCAFYLLVKVN